MELWYEVRGSAWSALLVISVGLAGCSDSTTRQPLSGSDADTDIAVGTDGGDALAPETDGSTDPDARPGGDTADTGPSGPPTFPLTPEPYTTLQRVWAPINPPERTRRAIDDGDLEITDIEEYQNYGLGVEPISGKNWVEHTELAPGYPGPLAGERRSLLYFWQSADPQLIDEESPIRFEGVTRAPVGSTFRPQDHLTTQIYESHVRSARRISEASGREFDFAFVSGDFTDGGQENEARWAFRILGGRRVHPDSGVDDDPVPGPGNDFTDPFQSRGIGVPWYMAVGNHETLYVGSIPATDSVEKAAVGNEVYDFSGPVPGVGNVDGLQNGYRDASTETAEVVTSGTTPADSKRRIVPLADLLQMIRNAPGKPSGHGLEAKAARDGIGYYSFHPSPGKPIRFVVLDTLYDDPAHVQGGVDDTQFQWLKGQLEEAAKADELVIVGGHHRLDDFTLLSDTGAGDIRDLLASYDNVLMYIVGHGHHNAIQRVDGQDGARGYWELMCASTVDFPLQSRIFELVYDGDGYLSIYVTNLGHNAPQGSLPHRARELAAARDVFFLGKDVRSDWREQHDASNLLIRYRLSDPLATSIEKHSWPKRIESLKTLDQFPTP